MTTIERSTYKQMEELWFNYEQLAKDVHNMRMDLISPHQEVVDENTDGGKSGRISAPTEAIATRLVTDTELHKKEATLTAIERVYNMLPPAYRRLAMMRYWTTYNKRTWEGIAYHLGICERQARRWRDQIMQATHEEIQNSFEKI
ncbi:hypothetical protein [Alkalicoccus chagannorensis]|uniref:hypothetical protein n=1 Tax=Alkalicoccus chagannorensis TaxID=427072 RepID=UPI00047A25AA|nr:hypothetical protein [Alkalicoccus chagannorensis]